ncbi:MAG: hypothetical protein ACI35O_00955 [Bacillaceae bacterium]
MLIAKTKGLDTVCIGGFNKKDFAELFKLENHYIPIVLIALREAALCFWHTHLPLKDITTFVE